MKLALVFVVVGGLAFVVANYAKKEKWFRCWTSLGGVWIACGVIHLIRELMKRG